MVFFTILYQYDAMRHTPNRIVSDSIHRGKVHSQSKFREITGAREKAEPPHDQSSAYIGARLGHGIKNQRLFYIGIGHA